MTALQDFLAMGGHGAFIWPCFALTAVIMLGLLVASLRRLRAAERAVAELEPRRRADQSDSSGKPA